MTQTVTVNYKRIDFRVTRMDGKLTQMESHPGKSSWTFHPRKGKKGKVLFTAPLGVTKRKIFYCKVRFLGSFSRYV